MDEPIECKGQNGAGIYFIMSDNYFPLSKYWKY
jgi:hypothetical protein